METLNSGLKLAFVAFGQGGTSLAQAIAHRTNTPSERIVSINSSNQDLMKAVNAGKTILIDEKGIGAGKNRDLAKSMIEDNVDKILNDISLTLGEDFDLLFSCYSADGGTGSGIGPALTTLLTSDNFKKKPTASVIGICILPDHNTDNIIGFQNTIASIKEANNILVKQRASMLFVDNDLYSSKDTNIETCYDLINKEVADLINRYINMAVPSGSSNLDFADRLRCLNQPGMHSFIRIQKKDDGYYYETPFVVPEGASVAKYASEIPTDWENCKTEIFNQIGCIASSAFVGLYNPSAESDISAVYPIAHFAGYLNLQKLSVKYDKWIKQLEQKDEKQKRIDLQKEEAFKNIKAMEERQKEKENVNSNKINGFNDLLSILDEDED